jgi:hypothetical protein
MEKSCSNCSQQAQFSLNIVVSSVGISRRIQKTSRAVLFCADCLDEFNERLCSDAISNAVNNVLTTLKERLRDRAQAKTRGGD